MTYKYLFGPVPSRRLGMSLGVDLVPRKVCSLDCVYCEVGKTTQLTLDRQEYIPFDKVKEELQRYFANNPDPDYITFSGSGEPTLNVYLGETLDLIKELRPNIPVAVLTNGTLLHDRKVRDAIKKADLILPSLDAATEEVFQKINRPAGGLRIEDHIRGLADFRKEYRGKIWLEVFILPGYNDSDSELATLKNVILKVRPDVIQLNTLDRPGTISGIRGATRHELERVREIWALDNVEIISSAPDRKSMPSYKSDVEAAIVATISRRPCTVDDLTRILGLHTGEVSKYLDVLEREGKILAMRQERGVFYATKTR